MIALLKKLHFYFIRGLFLIESRASKYIGTALTKTNTEKAHAPVHVRNTQQKQKTQTNKQHNNDDQPLTTKLKVHEWLLVCYRQHGASTHQTLSSIIQKSKRWLKRHKQTPAHICGANRSSLATPERRKSKHPHHTPEKTTVAQPATDLTTAQLRQPTTDPARTHPRHTKQRKWTRHIKQRKWTASNRTDDSSTPARTGGTHTTTSGKAYTSRTPTTAKEHVLGHQNKKHWTTRSGSPPWVVLVQPPKATGPPLNKPTAPIENRTQQQRKRKEKNSNNEKWNIKRKTTPIIKEAEARPTQTSNFRRATKPQNRRPEQANKPDLATQDDDGVRGRRKRRWCEGELSTHHRVWDLHLQGGGLDFNGRREAELCEVCRERRERF